MAIVTDSFPPQMDGVSRCALGYAKALYEGGYGKVAVVAPRVPRERYDYPFPVCHFRSVPVPYHDYRGGYPYMPKLAKRLSAMDIDIIHSHSPFTAMKIAQGLRRSLHVPIVYTQHTKWDFDLACAVPTKFLQRKMERWVYKNLSKADELWAVSRGTGEHLISRGYKGGYIVMPNGTDFPQCDADPALTERITRRYDLPDGVPILICVCRIMKYKGIGFTIDALEILRGRGFDFRMFFVGDGDDLAEFQKMTEAKGISDAVYFTGRVSDREMLRAYYTRSDLFVLPSIYDNAPLTVLEAAACACPSLVIRGSSTAEIMEDGVNGYFTEQNAQGVADAIQQIFSDRERHKRIAEAAAEQVYMPWDKVIKRSVERYAAVKQSYGEGHERAVAL